MKNCNGGETIEERTARVIRQLSEGSEFILDCAMESIYTKDDAKKKDDEESV